ncbi:LOW QUALITY PROTEIN: centrosomal protein 15 kDa [Stegostoma tigrinum]|uniref:LOW QUALITY PROTEIN: centrosomal protein 15 kDa n=1 Tax=Stegostoma tigrinum TaxID=3053191 RepID=UPI00287006C6|nr:LOW QUALITY PROTEIN: centrosomal protein 15 kDa [Stegostoma tigrinum]
METSYFAHEVELSKRHEEILGLRTTLLQQMEEQLESQANKKKLQAIEFESANERNRLLLTDLGVAEENLKARACTHLHPLFITLQTKYWTFVEEHLPKWEQFLLGQAESPVEVTNPKHKKSRMKKPQDKVTFESNSLLLLPSIFKTPQSAHQKNKKGHRSTEKGWIA